METVQQRFQKLVQGMLKKRFFVMFAEPVEDAPKKSQEEQMAVLVEHIEYVIDLEKKRKLFAAGPFVEADGSLSIPGRGMFILRVETREEAQRIADQDPFQKSGLRRNEIHWWQLNEGSYTVRVNYSDTSVTLE